MIEIWGKPNCPYCEAAKRLCESRHLPYLYKQLEVDFNRDEILAEFPGAKTFPQIKINEQKIGGYTELTKYIEETGYTGTGHSL